MHCKRAPINVFSRDVQVFIFEPPFFWFEACKHPGLCDYLDGHQLANNGVLGQEPEGRAEGSPEGRHFGRLTEGFKHRPYACSPW